VSDEQLVIDDEWFSSLTDYIKVLIDDRLHGNYVLGKVNMPHAYQVDDHPDRLLTTVYQSYLDGFDYHVWYSPELPNGPKDVKIIRISDSEKAALLNKDLTALTDLEAKISDNIENGKEYFVRLSSTSGKNEKAVRPFGKAVDIIKHLMSVKLFAEREYSRDKETCLILMPWQNIISNRCEFRIFVVNDKLTAASPQVFWELHQYSAEELEAFEQALSSIEFIGKVPYHTFVADVFINIDTKICHLIELNPFGPASGAGASLFNWITDYDILYGLPTIEAVAYEEYEDGYAELRYLSAINY